MPQETVPQDQGAERAPAEQVELLQLLRLSLSIIEAMCELCRALADDDPAPSPLAGQPGEKGGAT